MPNPTWIDLPGVVNMRDLGGLPTVDGRLTLPDRLIRSDNLQDLTPDAVHSLIHDRHLTDVVDLRTLVEEALEGAGPLRSHPEVHHHYLTLYRERAPQDHGIPAAERALAWEKDEQEEGDAVHDPATHDQFWSGHYLRYLDNRPDNVVAALRVIAYAEGATIVHCAAGKDRTGTVVGLALGLVGVTDEAIIEDFAASAQRVPQILDRLRAKATYAQNLRDKTVAQQSPQPETMRLVLRAVRERYDGMEPYVRHHGFTDRDLAALRHRLLDEGVR